MIRMSALLKTTVSALTVITAAPPSVLALDAGQAARVEACSCPTYSRDDIQDMVIVAAERHNVPPALALAVARVESNFEADALSHVGARGVMQIMPATGRGEFGVQPYELWDAELNIDLGVTFLRRLYNTYGERWDAALSHYNGGSLDGDPETAEPHNYTADYVARVFEKQAEFEASSEMQSRIAQVATTEADPRGPSDLILLGGTDSEPTWIGANAACQQVEPVIVAETVVVPASEPQLNSETDVNPRPGDFVLGETFTLAFGPGQFQAQDIDKPVTLVKPAAEAMPSAVAATPVPHSEPANVDVAPVGYRAAAPVPTPTLVLDRSDSDQTGAQSEPMVEIEPEVYEQLPSTQAQPGHEQRRQDDEFGGSSIFFVGGYTPEQLALKRRFGRRS